jgi:hypothetical protein
VSENTKTVLICSSEELPWIQEASDFLHDFGVKLVVRRSFDELFQATFLQVYDAIALHKGLPCDCPDPASEGCQKCALPVIKICRMIRGGDMPRQWGTPIVVFSEEIFEDNLFSHLKNKLDMAEFTRLQYAARVDGAGRFAFVIKSVLSMQ